VLVTSSVTRARVMFRAEQMYRQTDGQTQTKGTLGWIAADRILDVWVETCRDGASVCYDRLQMWHVCLVLTVRCKSAPLKGNI
jgi:hypothetical protein